MGLPKKHEDKKLKQVSLLFEADDDIKILKELRSEYLQSYGEEKKMIEKKFRKTQERMFKKSLNWGSADSQTSKLSQWDPFSGETATWFDPEWMFGNNDGFDIVIANPPYGSKIDKKSIKIIQKEIKDTKNMNSAALFIDFGKNKFLSKDGILTFIVPKSLLYSERWFALVKSMLGKVNVLIDVEKAFEKVLLEQVVFVYSGFIQSRSFMAIKFKDDAFIQTTYINNDLVMRLQAWICDVSNKEISILNKVLSGPVCYMRNISETKRGVGLQKHLSKSGDCPIIGGANIFRYGIDGNKGYLSNSVINSKTKKIGFMRQKKIVSQDVIAHIQNPSPHIKIMSYLDNEGLIFGLDTVQNTIIYNEKYDYRYILAVLNSSFVSWYTYKFIYCSAIRTMHFDRHYMGKIIIPDVTIDKQLSVIRIVDKIIAITKSSNYLNNAMRIAEVEECEKRIDLMVYELYGLTSEEIDVVAGSRK